jgi:hypothetical protein
LNLFPVNFHPIRKSKIANPKSKNPIDPRDPVKNYCREIFFGKGDGSPDWLSENTHIIDLIIPNE